MSGKKLTSAGLDKQIEALSLLPLLEYELARVDLAKAIAIPLGRLDRLVKARRSAREGTALSGSALKPREVELVDYDVVGQELLDELVAAINSYIWLPAGAALAIALWILHTYAMENWYRSPRLTFLSPTKRCGKTRSLEVLEHLVPRPIRTDNISPSALFRSVDAMQPTLLIDEIDTRLKKGDDLHNLLN